MNSFKSHFRYNHSQRNGILFLALLIIGLQLCFYVVNFSSEEQSAKDTQMLALLQQEIDSLKVLEIERRKPKIYPFNPSFLTDYRGYQLGMSTTEIDRLLQHRANGKYINSAKQFQQVTQVNDSLLAKISPYFKFPNWVTHRKPRKKTGRNYDKEASESIVIKDLNAATAEELQVVNGIGEKLSSRIVKYRSLLKGFLVKEQLYEVWGIEHEVADGVLERFAIQEVPRVTKINVNTASFKEVFSIVYIDYELTKKIFAFKDEVAELQSLEELKEIDGFPLEKFERIALYLEAK